jgi:hypothetical protein
MNKVFMEESDGFVVVFIDDMLIYSETVDGVFWYTKHVHYTLVWI